MGYRKPDGTTTDDCDLYLKEWHRLADAVLKVFRGYELHSFDPGFKFVKYEKLSGGRTRAEDSIELSVFAVNILIKYLENS